MSNEVLAIIGEYLTPALLVGLFVTLWRVHTGLIGRMDALKGGAA